MSGGGRRRRQAVDGEHLRRPPPAPGAPVVAVPAGDRAGAAGPARAGRRAGGPSAAAPGSRPGSARLDRRWASAGEAMTSPRRRSASRRVRRAGSSTRPSPPVRRGRSDARTVRRLAPCPQVLGACRAGRLPRDRRPAEAPSPTVPGGPTRRSDDGEPSAGTPVSGPAQRSCTSASTSTAPQLRRRPGEGQPQAVVEGVPGAEGAALGEHQAARRRRGGDRRRADARRAAGTTRRGRPPGRGTDQSGSRRASSASSTSRRSRSCARRCSSTSSSRRDQDAWRSAGRAGPRESWRRTERRRPAARRARRPCAASRSARPPHTAFDRPPTVTVAASGRPGGVGRQRLAVQVQLGGHLVDDGEHPLLPQSRGQSPAPGGRQARAGRVGEVRHHEAPAAGCSAARRGGPRVPGRRVRRRPPGPACTVRRRRAHHAEHAGVRRVLDQHPVPGLQQRLEHDGGRVAHAGGDHHLVGPGGQAAGGEPVGDRPPAARAGPSRA